MYPKRFGRPLEDLTGKAYGKLTVLEWAGNSRWVCACECGRTTQVITANLKRGNTSSCGCVRNIGSSKRATTHGLSKTLAYKTWVGIRRRCREVNHPSYPAYGGAGIDMHQPWFESVEAFVRDVGQPPTPEYTLDRIRNAEGYVPGNVRWATQLEQANNKRNNVWVTYQGERYTIAQLAAKIALECGIKPAQFRRALEKQIY